MSPWVSSTRRWPGMRSEYAAIAPHEDSSITRAGQVGVAFSRHEDVAYAIDGRWHQASYDAGALVLSGGDPIVWSDVRDPTEALEIVPDPALLGALTGGPPIGLEEMVGEAIVGGFDAAVLGVASQLRRAHATGAWLSDVAASTLAHVLARQVLGRYGGIAVAGAGGGGPSGLGRTALDAVAGRIESDLGGSLSLDALADAACLSPFHFARAFKATVGTTPHRYVTARRMERARSLLARDPSATVHEVAAHVGFDNLSHFRRVFRAHHGALPSVFRAERSGRLAPGPAGRATVVRSRS